MSALTYGISGILFHSGATNQDVIHLDRLGVCMSPDMILGMQRRFGENFDVKGLIWKNSLKKRPVLAQLNSGNSGKTGSKAGGARH